jgi:hypothetical protein
MISKYSWELLTKVYGLEPSRLYVTYFEGDAAGGLEPDTEAKELWLAAGVPEDHIVPGNLKVRFTESIWCCLSCLLCPLCKYLDSVAIEMRGSEFKL